jgi:HAD superfamily hydrolase (TIGR01509 family)
LKPTPNGNAIRTLLFDLGGVFVEVHVEKGLSALQKLWGSVPPEALRRTVLDPELLVLYERGRIRSKAFHAELVLRTGVDVPFDAFARAWQDVFTLNEPMASFVQSLRGKFVLVALSNTNELHVRRLSECYDFMNCFDHHVYSFETGFIKPEAEIYLRALDAAGAEAGTSLFIDDLRPNVEAARALGIQAFHFTGNADFRRFWEERFPAD